MKDRLTAGLPARARRVNGHRTTLVGITVVTVATLLLVVAFRFGWPFAQDPATSPELTILPLIDSTAGDPRQAPARELARQLGHLGDPARVLPFSGLDEFYGAVEPSDRAVATERLRNFVSTESRFTLRWEVTRFADTPVLSVEVTAADGQVPSQRLEYPLPGSDSLALLLAQRLPADVEAFLFSWRGADSSFPSGYEQLRPRPITWSAEAAGAYVEAVRLSYGGEHWKALALVNRALQIDEEFAQAHGLYSYLIVNVQVPYTGPVLALPAVERALQLRNRLEPWEAEILERAGQFLRNGPGVSIAQMDEEVIARLGEHRQSWLRMSILLFQNRRQDLLDYSLERLQQRDGPNVLWVQGPPSALDLGFTAEEITSALEPVLQAHPDHPWAHLTAGLCLIEREETIDLAEVEFERARELTGGRWHPSLAWAAGKMQYYAGHYSEAEETLVEAIAQQRLPGRFEPDSRLAEMSDAPNDTGDPRLYAFLALTYRDTGRLDDARQQIDLYRSVLPPNPWGDYQAGRIMSDAGEHEASIDAFTASLDKDPGYRYAYYSRAQALRSAERPLEALPDLERFIELMGPLQADVPSVQDARRAIAEIRRSHGLPERGLSARAGGAR